jgi:hypothetical protein
LSGTITPRLLSLWLTLLSLLDRLARRRINLGRGHHLLHLHLGL